MRLVLHPDELLRQTSAVVSEVTDETRDLLRQMHELMVRSGGIGLAAPQVGILKRMIVVDLQNGKRPWYFVNPVVTDNHSGVAPYREGCLSVPGTFGEVVRPKSVNVKYTDFNGDSKEIVCTGMMAVVVQHEVDHLDGILHIDKMLKGGRAKR